MTLDLQQLEAFSTIVRVGSLGRAAAALNVTQPALSRTVKRLEEKIGAPLFERHSKGMLLTEIGRALAPRATVLEAEAQQAMEEINALRGLARGTIRVGAVASVACFVLPMAIGNLLKTWPGLKIEVIEGVWDVLASALTNHEIDLALGVDAPDTDEIVAIRDCHWEDSSYVVAASDHPLRLKDGLKLGDTLEEQWAILPKGTGPRAHLEWVFAGHGLGLPKIVVETRSITVLKSLIADSGFLSWMAEPMYQAERRANVIDALPIPGISSTRSLVAFRRRRGNLPSPSSKLLDELRKSTKDR